MRAQLLLLCIAFFTTASARADHLAALAPSYLESRQREDQRLATQLETTLRAMADVVTARVHIGHVDASHLPIDAPLPTPRVSAFLKLSGQGPQDHEIRALLASALPDVLPQDISITRQTQMPATTQPLAMDKVGPFQVSADGAPYLRVLLGVLLASNASLCGLILMRRRHRPQ